MLGAAGNQRLDTWQSRCRTVPERKEPWRIGIPDGHSKVMPQSEIARMRKCVRCWAGGERCSPVPVSSFVAEGKTQETTEDTETRHREHGSN